MLENKKQKIARKGKSRSKRETRGRKAKVFDFETIWSLPHELKLQAIEVLRKTANRRLRALEEAGYLDWAYKMAMDFIEKGKRFRKLKKDAGSIETTVMLTKLEAFLSAKTSTPGGHRAVQSRQQEIVEYRLKKEGIDTAYIDWESFWKEVKRRQKEYDDSDQMFVEIAWSTIDNVYI